MDDRKGPLGFTHRFEASSHPETAMTLLLLHGTGGDESDLIPLGRAIHPDASLLSPRGKVMEGPMPRFFRRLQEGVFDQEDLVRRTHELADFIQEASRHYGFDAGKVLAVGLSNGANIAASLLLLRPGTLAGAVLFRPMVPVDPELEPDLTGIPVMIAAGQADPLVPRRETERLDALLQRFGAQVDLEWSGAGHGMTQEDLVRARSWMEKVRARHD